MPTQRNIEAVDDLRGWIEQCTIAITADFSGLRVSEMTGLRRALREKGVQFRVVKNRLVRLAADAAGRPAFKEIVDGPTAIAFGYGEPAEPARALAEYIRATRSSITIRGGLMGDRTLSSREVNTLATLPSKEELVAQLLSRLQAPIAGLVSTLNAPISGLARVLQAQVDKEGQ